MIIIEMYNFFLSVTVILIYLKRFIYNAYTCIYIYIYIYIYVKCKYVYIYIYISGNNTEKYGRIGFWRNRKGLQLGVQGDALVKVWV